MKPSRRWLQWSLLWVGAITTLGVVVAVWRDSAGPKQYRPIHEWPRVQEVPMRNYQRALMTVRANGLMGTVILPDASDTVEAAGTMPASDVGFVAPQVCGQCHADQWHDCQKTAHFLASSEPTRSVDSRRFEPPHNRVKTFHPQAWFEMVAKPSGDYQQLHIEHEGESFRHEAKIDLVIGSGKMGHSYLTWVKDALHQLPVSFFTDGNRWGSSPGSDYADGVFNFARPITERCLDCHATRFERVPRSINRFYRNEQELGVTCSRCHGRGREHVEHHQANPHAIEPHAIVNPAKLSRELGLAVCAQCHSGEGELVSKGFRYQPGEPLAKFLTLANDDANSAAADPHAANQLRRLEKSACFQKSEMSCFTCHDAHRNERGQATLFVDRCLKCHQPDNCGQRKTTGTTIDRLCVECHMPLVEDTDVRVLGEGAMPVPKMRDHRIQIWRAATDDVLKRLNSQPSVEPKEEAKPDPGLGEKPAID